MSSKGKRIAKNTVMLYFRMLFVLLASLYVSRVVLEALGVQDYGIYSAVGGVVSLFNVICSSLTSATQRFISYALGQNCACRIKTVFSSSIYVHTFLCVLILILAETAGLWFVENKMNIPGDRVTAAYWVYQFSVLSLLLMIASVPYNALIIAHERMEAFAYISILDALMRLVIAFAITKIRGDELVLYALLICCAQLIIRFCYTIYCWRHFEESHRPFRAEWKVVKEMAVFSGWSFWGNAAYVSYNQGINVLLNVFFSPVVNAARAVTIQVQSAGLQLLSGFQTAVSPQITKSYAEGNLVYMHQLLFMSMRLSYYLMLILAVPLVMETDVILGFWLKEIPEHTHQFIRLVIITTLINSFANPMIYAVKAAGRIKLYEFVVGGLMLMILPISYCFLKAGFPPDSVFVVHLLMEIIAQFARVFITKKLIGFAYKELVKYVIKSILLVSICTAVLSFFVYTLSISISAVWNIVWCCLYVGCCLVSIYLVGLTAAEKNIIRSKISQWASR